MGWSLEEKQHENKRCQDANIEIAMATASFFFFIEANLYHEYSIFINMSI